MRQELDTSLVVEFVQRLGKHSTMFTHFPSDKRLLTSWKGAYQTDKYSDENLSRQAFIICLEDMCYFLDPRGSLNNV